MGCCSDSANKCAYKINLKFVALHVPEIIVGTLKTLGSPWIRPPLLFSEIFNGLLFGWTLRMFRPHLKSVALPVSEIIAIEVFGGGCKPPILEAVGCRGWYPSNERW